MLKSYAMAFSGDGKHLAVAGVRKLGRKRSYDAVEVWRNTGNSWRLEKSLKMNPAVSCIALSRDGRWLALGSRDHKIYLRDLDRKASMKTLSGHKTTIVSLGFSQDGKRLVSGGDEGRVILWDLEKSKQRYDLPQGLVGLRAVAIQPDGHFVAMSDSQVTIWSASTGMQALAYRGGSNARISGLSPDGLRAVFADWNRIQVWSLEVPSAKDRANRLHGILSRTGRYRIEGGSREGSGCIEFSPDSKLLASAERSSIRLIKVATGTLARRLKPGAHILRFSPDGTKLAAGAMGRVRVYRVTDGRLLHTLKGHAKNITGLVFSPDGKRLYSCSTDATRLDTVFQVTDPASGRQLSSYKPLKGRREDLAISPDGKLLFLDANPIQVVRAEDLKPVRTVPGSSPLALSPDGSILAARERHGGMIFQNPAVRLTQVTTGKRIRALVGHSKRVGSLAFSPDGKWLATGYRKTRIWSVADGRQLWLLDNKQDYAAGMLAFSPDGRLLATGGSADIVLWSLEKLRKGTPVIGAIRPREGHLGKIILLRYSGDGRWLLSSGVDRKLRVWDSATGKLHRTLTLENALNSGVAISKDGTKIAATSSGHTTVWDRDSGRQIAAVQGKHGVLAFVGEGKQLLVADPQGQLLVADTQVRIIELSTGRKVRSFEGSHHLGSISTDGRLLV
ncbi:WD40 repeat domain-containing protein, partial [bacterium AH-315-M10]|nr:WD40 repeat domain-containing protein [bacterium AH-315-M10]